MMGRVSLTVLFALVVMLGLGIPAAHATNYVVYLHGRSMSTWPSAANLGVPGTWTHAPMSFNGSKSLSDPVIRSQVRTELSLKCRGANQCILVCYSAGCARMLLAFDELRAQGTPADRVLWTEAAASAAGGTELAAYSTNAGISLLRKIFLTNPGPDAEAIDRDLKVNNMRSALGYIQNAAPAVIYHLAGSKNICIKTKIRGLSTLLSQVGQWVGDAVAGPVGSVVGGVLGSLFGSKAVKLCSNGFFPGGYGDGAVPVHSAAGYSDTSGHSSHHDGGPKYNLRAYEQVPLFNVDHTGIFEPAVERASLRLAINKDATCPGLPAEGSEDAASIVYEDGDSAVTEYTPGQMLAVCGQSALSDPNEYATCIGQDSCCDNFSSGSTGGCSCGEALCIQAKSTAYSYFTGPQCSGIEYSVGASGAFGSWDGLGLVGNQTATVAIASVRTNYGACLETTTACFTSGGTVAYYPWGWNAPTMRRVYRRSISSYAPDPSGSNAWPGWIVRVQNSKIPCDP